MRMMIIIIIIVKKKPSHTYGIFSKMTVQKIAAMSFKCFVGHMQKKLQI